MKLAYKYVAMAVMMVQANFLMSKLHLKESEPIRSQDIIAQRIHGPFLTGFIGGIDTTKYHFGFFDSGREIIITKLEDFHYQSMGLYRGNQSMKEFMERFSKIKSTIDTNDAYRLATNWLTTIGIDVERLQKENPVKVQQQFTLSKKGGEVPCPLFYVQWGKQGEDQFGHPRLPVIEVMISGINRELLHLIVGNDAYAKRPFALLKDTDKLLAIPDAKFLKYSSEERSNLVARFSAFNYSQSNAPPTTK